MTLDNWADPWLSTSATLTGGAVVHFDTPHSEASDTPEIHPVEFWLAVCPTAEEGNPD